MRHRLPDNPEDQLLTQDEARQLMRVKNTKPRYTEAFAKAGLVPAEIHGRNRLFRRGDVVAARRRLDEIEARELAAGQGSLGLQQARGRLTGTLAAIAAAKAVAPKTGILPQFSIADDQPEPWLGKAQPPAQHRPELTPPPGRTLPDVYAGSNPQERPETAGKPDPEPMAADTHRLARQLFSMVGEAKRDIASVIKILSTGRLTADGGIIRIEVHHYIH